MIQTPTTLCARQTKKSENTGYCGNTWVEGKAELGEAVFLGEPS